jgi:chromosome segregation ATPase
VDFSAIRAGTPVAYAGQDIMSSPAITKDDLQELATTIDASIARLDAKLDANTARLDAKLDANTAVLGSLTDEVHRTGVLLEQLEGKVQVAFEGITSTQEQFQRAMLEMEQRLGERITMLEHVVRDLAGLPAEVAELRRRFDSRQDLEVLERRVTELEERVGRRRP